MELQTQNFSVTTPLKRNKTLPLNKIILGDALAELKKLPDESCDVIVIDPPYNIGKDFGNNTDKRELKEYVAWCKEWINECIRTMKPSGTMFIYGFSEILAHLSVEIPINKRWLIWHYTNKNMASCNFWQRSHEAIICAWKDKPIFNKDEVREPYTEGFLNGAAGKIRTGKSIGRLSRNGIDTIYNAHPNGALPRDVIKIPALAGGAGMVERWFLCKTCNDVFEPMELKKHEKHEIIKHPTQKPLELSRKLILSAMPKKDGVVLVPFVGTGSECVAAKQLGQSYIGFEINPEYIRIAKKMLGDNEVQLKSSKTNSLTEKKNKFLEQIKSANPSSQNKYKRVALSPIRYAGGKSLAVGHIVELIPDNIKKVVSPFFGGGSIEIAISKHLGLEVIGYDIFDILCNYWKFQIEKPKLLYEKLKALKPDKKTFEKIRLILNDVWKKKVKLDPLTLAVYYVYNFNLSYGPGFMGWASDIYLDENRYERMLERIKNFKPENLKVECADFQEVIKKHPNDFLYCDPPYYIGEDSKMFKGIYPMRNIPVHHNGFPHEILRNLLKNHKGGFILSYNNCPTIREFYKEYQQFFPRWQYTMGQGETRIGKNRIENGDNHIKNSHELIVFCPPKTISKS